MGYGALTAFLVDGELPPPTTLDLAKRLVWGDFKKVGLYFQASTDADEWENADRAAELIAKLIEQEIKRCASNSDFADETAQLKENQ